MDSSGQIQRSMAKRLTFLLDLTVLESLCSPGAVARLEREADSLRGGHLHSFLRGYRLAIATPLYGLLEEVFDNPEMLGFEFDEGLYNFLFYPHSTEPLPPSSAISEPRSGLARLCYMFDDLYRSLRTAPAKLDETVTVIQSCGSFAARVREIMTGTKIVSLATGEDMPDMEALLRGCLAHRILDYVYHPRMIIFRTYATVWNGEAEYRPADDLFVRRAETHLDDVALFPDRRTIPAAWMDGVALGFNIVAHMNGLEFTIHSDSESVDKDAWYAGIRDFGDRARFENDWPRERAGLTEFSLLHLDSMLEEVNVNVDRVSSKQRLTANLGPDTVRLITSAESTAPQELEMMLSGAVSGRGDSKVHVLRLNHSGGSDSREWVSFAFRLPLYGTFSNASKWFLFYKVYHTGDMVETDVIRNYRAVTAILSRFAGDLEVEEINSLDSADILTFCNPPAFQAMRKLALDAEVINSDLRAVNSELLAAMWLVYQGFREVRVSLTHASLGETDYDAIGVKDGNCLVVEVKGGNVIDEELEGEIDRFSRRVSFLQERRSALSSALGSGTDIENVQGLFVSLADLTDLASWRSKNTSIDLWDYDIFVEALKDGGLSQKRLLDLLDRAYIIRTEGFADVFEFEDVQF